MKTSNKHIVIDVTPSINDIRAIKRYCHNLSLELSEIKTDLRFDLIYLGLKNHSELPLFKNNNHIKQIQSTIPGKILKPLWKYFNNPKLAWWIKEPFDLVHFPGGMPYIPTNCKKRLTTMHGFASKYIPEYIENKTVDQMNRQLDHTIEKSTDFVTVSEANKKEMIDLWNISPDRITAIPLGVSPEFKIYDLTEEQEQRIYKRYKLPNKPFILFVGALEPHKNIKNIIQAYHKLPVSLIEQYQLVLVGKETSYCKGYKEQIISLGLSNNVSFVDYIQPGSLDLAYLYNMAHIFVSPTFYEGWASPPLEAMKCGTPTIVSNIQSLRESTGGISLYADPQNPDGISQKIQELLEDKILYKQQQRKGIEFVQQYTWKRCAEKTLALYDQLLKK